MSEYHKERDITSRASIVGYNWHLHHLQFICYHAKLIQAPANHLLFRKQTVTNWFITEYLYMLFSRLMQCTCIRKQKQLILHHRKKS